jgi:two-component system, cell cycle response regulator DivK
MLSDRKTVVVVDDHLPTREAYAALLTDSGYRVFEASNGGEAIVLVRRHEPDVVLMDVLMPVLGGVEAAASLRAYPETAGVPILAVTATAGQVEQERMRRVCDDILIKPCSPEDILSRMRQLTTH